MYSPTKILESKYISRQCDNFAQHYQSPCISMGIKVGGMIIGLIINVLQLESESLEQLFLPSLWCDITCCQTQPPAQDMFDHQLINPFTFLTSHLTLTMKYINIK